MFEIIKEQWQEGCYSSASDLDIYVQAGWITQAQEDEIVGKTSASTSNDPSTGTATGTTTTTTIK